MIYKYTKCEPVIAKIMADSGMEGTHFRVTDIREWIFEAISKIGAPMQYINRESGEEGCPIMKIEDKQVPIPCDLEHLSTIAYSENENGPWIIVRSNNQSFRYNNKISQYDHYEPIQPMQYKELTCQCQLYGINGMKSAEKMIQHNEKEDVQCFIKPGWIVLNRNKGYIKIAYKAIATDERGYPLIPDTSSYQEAVYWYVMMKLNFPKYLSGKLGGKGVNSATNVYYYLQQQWNFYRNQAYADAMMPTETDMINIKNEWNKLVPEWDSDESFFESSGNKQLNYTDYYYGY